MDNQMTAYFRKAKLSDFRGGVIGDIKGVDVYTSKSKHIPVEIWEETNGDFRIADHLKPLDIFNYTSLSTDGLTIINQGGKTYLVTRQSNETS